jgi:NADH dehydrogenase, FAD-containing subunit
MSRTLILGGGFGGIAVAAALRGIAPSPREIVLVDRNPEFVMGLRKLWELVGLGTLAEGSRPRARLDGDGVRFVEAEIESIDPESRSARVGGRTLEGDHLVVALGAVPRPDLVPGLAEHAHDVWDPAGVPALRDALAAFAGGRIAILIAGVPYTCPPAPYECAMLLHDHLAERGLRARTELSVATVQPLLLPNAGKEGSAWLASRLEERGIAHAAGKKIGRVERDRVVFEDGALPFDLLIGVPPHRPPEVVASSPLAGEGGWIAVDPGTLATSFPGVFAIGDVTAIRLANGLPLRRPGSWPNPKGSAWRRRSPRSSRAPRPPLPSTGGGSAISRPGSRRPPSSRGSSSRPRPRRSRSAISPPTTPKRSAASSRSA